MGQSASDNGENRMIYWIGSKITSSAKACCSKGSCSAAGHRAHRRRKASLKSMLMGSSDILEIIILVYLSEIGSIF